MHTRAPRFLLVFASVLLALGGVMHAVAFRKAAAAIASSGLSSFFGGSYKALWLADSANMFVLAALFGLLAARPSSATRPLVLLLALLPGGVAILIYMFLGGFFAGHILAASAAAVFLAGLRFPESWPLDVG